MGAQRIQEAIMFALLFLLIGVIILLAAAGIIWIDTTPVDSPAIDSAGANNPGEPATSETSRTAETSWHS